MLHDLSIRITCAIKAYHTAMEYKARPGERPREIAKKQVAIFLDAAEREYRNLTLAVAPKKAGEKHGYFYREF